MGGSFDSATGFTTFGVRYYDATTGRWTQQDPKAGSLFDARSSNRYVYAKCDPVNVTDPGGADVGQGIDRFTQCMLGGYDRVSRFALTLSLVSGGFGAIAVVFGFTTIGAFLGGVAAGALSYAIGYCGAYGIWG